MWEGIKCGCEASGGRGREGLDKWGVGQKPIGYGSTVSQEWYGVEQKRVEQSSSMRSGRQQ